MRKPSVKCALLAAMIAEHRWGSPIVEENLLAIAAIEPGDYATASEVFDELRTAPYITSQGKRGIELNNSRFDELADVLFHECEWESFEIKSRLKHYEGWDQHAWA
jgi:beta-xylosidase